MTTEMIRTHPMAPSGREAVLERALRALAACAQSCTLCADACLAEPSVAELRSCIRLNLDCADVCAATASVIARQVGTIGAVVDDQLQACVAACQTCAAECERHADMHAHCRVCAEACRRCADACREFLASLAGGAGV